MTKNVDNWDNEEGDEESTEKASPEKRNNRYEVHKGGEEENEQDDIDVRVEDKLESIDLQGAKEQTEEEMPALEEQEEEETQEGDTLEFLGLRNT